MEKSTYFILSSSFSRFAVCSLSIKLIKVLLRVGRYLPFRVPADLREIKLDVTWSYVKRKTAKMTSEFLFFSYNPSLNHIKIEKCLLLFATNTNNFTLLFKELKTDGISFILVHVTSSLISLLSLGTGTSRHIMFLIMRS